MKIVRNFSPNLIPLWTKQPMKLEFGPMPNVVAAQPNMSGALCESSAIPFLVPCLKVWLTPLLECRAVMLHASIREH